MRTVWLNPDEIDEAVASEKWHTSGPERDPEPVLVRRTPEERRLSSIAWLYAHGFDADGNPLPTEDRA